MTNIFEKPFKSDKNNVDHIQLEPAYLAEHKKVLAAHGYDQRRSYTNPKQSYRKCRPTKASPIIRAKSSESIKRPVNPIGRDCIPLICNRCGSYRHFLKTCPYSNTNNQGRKLGDNVLVVEKEVTEGDIENAMVEHHIP